MKYGACYVLFNEEDYIEKSIDSIYNWADKIYILLGVPFDGVSMDVDKTKEIVLAYPDKDRKICVMETDETDETICKNYLRGLCVKDSIDYCWIVDGDEVYDERNMKPLFKMIEKTEPELVKIYCLEYWRSIHHVISMAPHYTFFKADKIPIRIRSPAITTYNTLRTPNNAPIFHHYGLAKTVDRIRMKYTSTRIRERKDTKFNLEMWLADKFVAWEKDHTITDLYPFRKDIWNKTTKAEDIYVPEIMKDHKWYGVDCIK